MTFCAAGTTTGIEAGAGDGVGGVAAAGAGGAGGAAGIAGCAGCAGAAAGAGGLARLGSHSSVARLWVKYPVVTQKPNPLRTTEPDPSRTYPLPGGWARTCPDAKNVIRNGTTDFALAGIFMVNADLRVMGSGGGGLFE